MYTPEEYRSRGNRIKKQEKERRERGECKCTIMKMKKGKNYTMRYQ